MFSRTPRISHICLRCQRDLARRATRYPERSSRPFLGGRSIRHQTAAAAKVVDEADDRENEHTSPLINYDHAPHQDGTASKRPTQYSYKKLKRPRTAGLGVKSLGKPSEIILLPSHDRILPESVDYIETPKQDLSAAIESEKVPLPWEQVKEYIEQAHSGLEKREGLLDLEEWDALKLALKRGFSRVQLHRFLQEEAKGNPDIPEDARRLVLAKLIATHVWGYQLPELEPQKPLVAEQENTAEPEATATKEFTNEYDLLLLQRDTKNGLQALSRSKGVSVSVRGHTVTVKGTKAAVKKAKNWLKVTRTRMQDVDLEGFGEIFFVESRKKHLADLDRRISEDRGVVLTKHTNNDGMTVRYLQPNKDLLMTGIRRQLRMLAEDPFKRSFLASARTERVIFVPYYTRNPPPWATENHWRRAFDPVAIGSTGMTRRAETSLWVEEQWQDYRKQLEHDRQEDPRETPNVVRCEFSARLGLNLYNHGPTTAYSGLTNPNRFSWFVDEVPLLTQLLANKDLQKQPTAATSDVPVEAPLLMRVLLKPVHITSQAPIIEIWLWGQDQAAGLRQTLNVARITAIFEESRTQHLSLPTLPVDVSFDRQIKQDLFVHHSPSTSQHPTLLQSIGVYLAKTRKVNTDIPEFYSFASLRIPTDLANLSGFADVKAGGTVEYVLAAAEEVRSNTRLIPDIHGDGDNQDVMLEHLIFDGGRWGANRQELRLVQQPLLTLPPVMGVGLDTLRDMSLYMGEKIGDLGRQLRHRMQSIK